MQCLFYISGHGFGHAARDIEIIEAIAALRPDTRFIVRTAVARWFFEPILERIEMVATEVDTGVAQIDSLRIDEPATLRHAEQFYATLAQRVDAEAAVIARCGADVVVGDIPPVAFAAAHRAGVPSVAVGNFTWDWIYAAYPEFGATDIVPVIARAYASTTRALRLPLSGGFESMASVARDIPFIARRSPASRAETRRALGVADERLLVLASFGAYGIDLSEDRLHRSARFTTITDRSRPPGVRYQDVVAAADVVITKPGYGIVSECIANDTAIVYTSRGHFAEYDVFVAGMPRYLRCRYLSNEDLLAGRWDEAVDDVLAMPRPPETPRIDGARVAAGEILELTK